MRGFIDEWRSDFRTLRPFVIWAVLTLIVGIAGPFGTYVSLSMAERLILWALIVFCSIAIGFSVRAFVAGTLKLKRFFDGALLTAGLSAIVLPPCLYAIFYVVDTSVAPPGYDELAIFVFLVSLSAGAYRLGADLGEAPENSAAQAASQTPKRPTQPRLLDRLPQDMQGALISISVRDHYVDVVTEKGNFSLLMRLSDAIAETEPTEGAQIHRSHWVAWQGVESLEKKGERLLLNMQQGAQLPVSKTYRLLVEARGIGMARADAPPHKMAKAPPPIRDDRAASSHHNPPV